jgi:hypothetical protein
VPLAAEVAALTFAPDGGQLAAVRGCRSYEITYDAEILWWSLRNGCLPG